MSERHGRHARRHGLAFKRSRAVWLEIDAGLHFDNTGNMDNRSAILCLAALAQDSRLEVFRLLVQTGPEGLPAGEIAERLGIPSSTLSFHVKELAHAGLVDSRQEGRFIYYSADFDAMNGLIAFLGENCCGGRSCAPAMDTRRRKASA